jgi:NAD(P)-dependent dehydrogenase (short-subunit alcohol dehydrogenase family)
LSELLNGLKAFVTGAAGGQGAEICRRFAAEGASILATDVGVPPVVDELRVEGCQATGFDLDLTDRAAIRRRLPDAFEAFGGVDVAVCAAGILSRHPFFDLDDDDWDRVMAVNLTAPVVTTQLVWPYLKKSGAASLIHISSTSPRLPMLNVGPAYMASKAGLWSLVTLFALEGAPDGIRVNGVAPGPIVTPMTTPAYPTPEIQALQTPMKRMGKPSEIASVCAFLASSESSFMTGTILNVSGGKLMG